MWCGTTCRRTSRYSILDMRIRNKSTSAAAIRKGICRGLWYRIPRLAGLDWQATTLLPLKRNDVVWRDILYFSGPTAVYRPTEWKEVVCRS